MTIARYLGSFFISGNRLVNCIVKYILRNRKFAITPEWSLCQSSLCGTILC